MRMFASGPGLLRLRKLPCSHLRGFGGNGLRDSLVGLGNLIPNGEQVHGDEGHERETDQQEGEPILIQHGVTLKALLVCGCDRKVVIRHKVKVHYVARTLEIAELHYWKAIEVLGRDCS